MSVLRESSCKNAVLGKSRMVQMCQSFPAVSKSYNYSRELFWENNEMDNNY
jgi:hypothetical protein